VDDKRQRILKLLADIDQEITEAEALAASLSTDDPDQQPVAAMLAELREALERVERMLGE
jgi:hypothetical protein